MCVRSGISRSTDLVRMVGKWSVPVRLASGVEAVSAPDGQARLYNYLIIKG